MDWNMDMTDHEIRESWKNCIDRKEHVKILAERNDVDTWTMMEKLKELKVEGLDGRWYQNLNPNRQQAPAVQAPRTVNTGTGERRERWTHEMITRLIIDYYEYGNRDDKPDYARGYAEATMNMIQTVIDLNIDPPGLE